MAGSRIRGITIEIDGETKGLQDALKDVNKKSNDLQRELKDVEKLLKFNPGNVQLLAQKQTLLNERIAATSDKLTQLRGAQSQVEAQFQAGTLGVEQYRAFQRELITTEGSLNGLKNQLQNMEREQQQAAESTRHLGALFDATGTSVDQYADLLGNRLTQSIREGTATSGQLEEAIERIGREALGSEVDINRLRDALRRVDDGANLDEIREDLNRIEQESEEAEEGVKGLGKELGSLVGGLAATGGIAGAISGALDASDLETKIKISMEVPEESIGTIRKAVGNITAYIGDQEAALEGVRRQWALNKNASDEANQAIVEYAGVIAKSFSGVDFTELIQEGNEIAAALKISNEEALALTNALLKAGFPPEQLDIISEYGMQLQNAGFDAAEIQAIFEKGIDTKSWNLDNLLDGAKEGRIRMAEFGQEIPKAFGDLLDKTEMSQSQFKKWGKAVAEGGEGGSKAMSDMVSWLNTIEDDTLKNALATQIFGTMWEDQSTNLTSVFQGLDKATDKTGQNFEKLNEQADTLNADPMVKMQQAVNDLKIAMAPLLATIADVVSAIATWVSNNPTLAATIAAVVAGLGILVGICMALAPIFVTLSGAAAALGVSIGAVALPVLAVIAAIGLLVAAGVLIWKNWDTIKEKSIEIWGAIKEFLAEVWEGIKTLASTVWEGIKSFFITTWNGIKSLASSIWNGIKSTISTVMNGIKTVISTIWNGIKSTLTTIWNGIKGAASSVWNGIKSTISSVVNGIKSTVSGVWNGIKSTTTTVWNGIKSAMTKPIETAKETISGIIDTVKGFFSDMKLKFPKIEMPALPHFKLKGDFSLNPPSVPTIGVEWYDKGGVFYGPQVIGVGEKRPEFVGALDDLRAIVSASMREVMSVGGTTNNTSSTNISLDGFMNGATFVVREDKDIREIARELQRLFKQEARSQGVIR